MDKLSKSLQKVAEDFRRGIGFGDIDEICEAAAARITALEAENAKLREALPSGAIENGRETMRRIEEWYNFQCEAGPLQTCGEWLDLKRCLAAITEHTATLSQIDKPKGTE